MDHSSGPIRPHGLVDNATAPSAGGSMDGLGEGGLEAATFSDDLRLGLGSPFTPMEMERGNAMGA
ncbi:MAG: hypothetical protein QM518_10235 [Verrucomicrobiota bacterium]|nr:hypothetical protein [Verrucomicrobiota bacterium]